MLTLDGVNQLNNRMLSSESDLAHPLKQTGLNLRYCAIDSTDDEKVDIKYHLLTHNGKYSFIALPFLPSFLPSFIFNYRLSCHP